MKISKCSICGTKTILGIDDRCDICRKDVENYDEN